MESIVCNNRNRTVYVVDDDKMMRQSMSFFLKAIGYNPHVFISGLDFLDEADKLRPGCVLLDFRMPEIDGLEVTEVLGSRRGKLPVVIVTGHGDIPTAVQAMKLGASDFLQKPFEEDALLQALDRVFADLDHQSQTNQEQEDAFARISRLTPRERDVLCGLIEGRSNKALAFKLDLSVRTIEMHRASMMHRLGVKALSGALRIAFRAGFVRSSPSGDETADETGHATVRGFPVQ